MALTDIAHVQALLMRDLTGDEVSYFPSLLELAEGVVMQWMPDMVFTGADDFTESVNGSRSDELWLPYRPVNSVASVYIDGSLLDPTEYVVNRWGPMRRYCGHWGGERATVTATFNAGLDTVPLDIQLATADILAGQYRNPGQIRQESIDGYSLTYAGAGSVGSSLGLTRQSVRTLNRYRRRPTSVEFSL